MSSLTFGTGTPPTATKNRFNLRNANEFQRAFLTSVLIWMLPNIIGIAAKYWFLSKHGFASLAGAFSVNALSLGQRLSFFRSDFLCGFFLIPICLALLHYVIPAPWYRWFVSAVTALAVLAQIVAFAELAILGNLAAGYGLLAEGLEWSIAHPKAALNYVLAYNFLRLIVTPAVIASGAAALILSVWPILKHRRRAIRKGIYFVLAIAWVASVPLTLTSWFPWMRRTGYHEAMISLSVRPLFESETGEGSYAGLTLSSLRAQYRRLANVADTVDHRSALYWGAARDYDVVLFVMETGPARLLTAEGSFSEFPNLSQLSQNAWIGTRHYTASPVSYKAVSSILLSMYPPDHNRTFAKDSPRFPGLIRSLHAAGYRTGVYLPDVPGVYSRQENSFYEAMGPDQVSVVTVPPVPGSRDADWRTAEYLDLAALRSLEKDFRASAAAGRRFFAIYLPQLSHEPWVDVTDGHEANMGRRRHNLMSVEDRHLGELVSTIKESGRLNRTLILVTCDHGLRSRTSDSWLPQGQIDDLTFHVPFVLYAPGIVNQQTRLTWPTSHIDVAPSILDLLGITEGRGFEMGAPIWNGTIKQRCIYFWGSRYFGSDGYECSGSFSMWNQMLNTTYRSPVQHFINSTVVPQDTAMDKEIRDRIQEMTALRNAWYGAAIRRVNTAPNRGN